MFFLNLTGEGLYNGANFKKEGIPWLGIVDGKYTIEFKLNLYSLVCCGVFLFFDRRSLWKKREGSTEYRERLKPAI
jgi:hypothetical protein